jgi:hypothetical protein
LCKISASQNAQQNPQSQDGGRVEAGAENWHLVQADLHFSKAGNTWKYVEVFFEKLKILK